MLRTGLLAASAALLCWSASAAAGQPSLVMDVNPDLANPEPAPALRGFTSLGSRMVFVLQRQLQDWDMAELWASDGTDGGTERLRSFANPSSRATVLAGNGRIAFFVVSDRPPWPASEISTLWRTDGTFAGTFPLAQVGVSLAESSRTLHAGSLFFSGCTADAGCEPWVSDGTAGGTYRLREITAGEYGSNPRDFVSLGGLVYFFADGPDGPGLWRTDGSRPSTRRAVLLPLYAQPHQLAAAGSRLFFTVGPEGYGPPSGSLWTSDGTVEGTRPVPPFDRPHGRGPVAVRLLGAFRDAELLVGIDPVVGSQIYRTDGTAKGTRRLTSFPGAGFATAQIVALAERLFFVGPDGKIWTTAGTRASTRPLAGCPGSCPTVYSEYGLPALVAHQGRVFFAGSVVPEEDVEPWMTDGTPEGTRRVDLCPGPCNSLPVFGPVLLGRVLFYAGGDLWQIDGDGDGGVRRLAEGANAPDTNLPSVLNAPIAAAGRRLVFAGFDKAAPPGESRLQIKSADGTPAGTVTLDVQLFNGADSEPRAFTRLGDEVLFFACSRLGFVWKTGGTPATTIPLGDGRVYCNDPDRPLVRLDGAAYYLAVGANEYWHEVWRTDGTPAGTYPITHLGPKEDVWALALFNGKLLFFTFDSNGDPEHPHSTAYASDGTPESTAKVFDLAARYVRDLFVSGGAAYFVAAIPDEGDLLFRSDGTPAGTRPLARISGTLRDPVQLGEQTFFIALDSFDGWLWKTDGTPEGTRQVVPPGPRVENITDLAQLGGRLYFMALDIVDLESSKGIPTLFRSDGTTAGTVRVKTFTPDESYIGLDFPPPRLTTVGGTLFFTATDELHGGELWKSDGTAAGTVLVRDIHPGPEPSRIGPMVAASGRIFFSADDGEHGSELWTSDGTAGGTRLAADVAPGARPSFPRELSVAGDRLFFSADDGILGREPWLLPLDAQLLGRRMP